MKFISHKYTKVRLMRRLSKETVMLLIIFVSLNKSGRKKDVKSDVFNESGILIREKNLKALFENIKRGGK